MSRFDYVGRDDVIARRERQREINERLDVLERRLRGDDYSVLEEIDELLEELRAL